MSKNKAIDELTKEDLEERERLEKEEINRAFPTYMHLYSEDTMLVA